MTSKPLFFLGVVIIIIAVLAAAGFIIKGSMEVKPQVLSLATTTVPITSVSSTTPAVVSAASTNSSEVIPYPASTTRDTSSWKIYVDKFKRYSIEHPTDLISGSSGDNFSLVFPKSLYFHWPLQDSAKVSITVGTSCPPVIEGGRNSKSSESPDAQLDTDFNLNGYKFKRSIGTGVGTGNIYTEIAYDTMSNGYCYHLSYYNHGTNGAGFYVDGASLINKYDAQHKIDMAESIDVFNSMVKTFRILAN